MKRVFTLLTLLLSFTAIMAQGGVSYTGGYTISGPAIPVQMDPYSFDLAINTIHNRVFSSTKMDLALSVIQQNCLSSRQVARLLNEFCFESDRREIARVAWFKVSDPANYFIVFDAFTFESSIRRLNAFMMANPRPAHVIPVVSTGCSTCGFPSGQCACGIPVVPTCGTVISSCGFSGCSMTTTHSHYGQGAVASSCGFSGCSMTTTHTHHGQGAVSTGGVSYSGGFSNRPRGNGHGNMNGPGNYGGGFDHNGQPRPIYNKSKSGSTQPLQSRPANTRPDPRKNGKVFARGTMAVRN